MELLERWVEDGTMRTIYMGIAAFGGGIILLQTLLQLFGIGDADAGAADIADMDVDDLDVGDGSISILSVRAMAAFLAAFGLTGWYGTNHEWSTGTIVLVSVGIGFAVSLLVAWIVSLQTKLQSKGNLDPRKAVGKTAQVYLRIPGERGGQGKIHVALQGRTAEFAAITGGDELPTGSEVRVLRMTTPGTFEVAPLDEETA